MNIPIHPSATGKLFGRLSFLNPSMATSFEKLSIQVYHSRPKITFFRILLVAKELDNGYRRRE